MSGMIAVLQAHPECKLFKVTDSHGKDCTQWKLHPEPEAKTIPKGEGLWLVEAIRIPPVQVVRDGTAWRSGSVRDVKIAVTSAPALVMSKARSFKDRAYGQGRPRDLPKAGKHAYDLFFLLTSTASGPSALAKEWGALAHHLLKGKPLDILTDDFASESSLGSRLAGGFIRANLGGATGLEQMVSEQVKLFVDSVR